MNSAKSFMKEFEAGTARFPLMPEPSRCIMLDESNGKAICFELFKTGENTIFVGLIHVLLGCRGEGHGSIALKWLIELANKHRVTLKGKIDAGSGLTNNQLRGWYKRYGFKVRRDRSIQYTPLRS